VKTRVLFVDDDAQLLASLRRSLRGLRDEWDMEFAEGGQAALAILRDRPFDVVVSDMQMPRMSGAELLERVRSDYPSTIRIVLSGQCDEPTAQNLVEGRHRFLSKPCDTDLLVGTITGSIRARQLVSEITEEVENDADASPDVSSLKNLFNDTGAITAIEVPVSIDRETARRTLEALAPILGIRFDEGDELATFLRFEFPAKDETESE
jgi:DNA-binding NtrC family response regulator